MAGRNRRDGWSVWLGDAPAPGESLVDGLARKPAAWESVPLTVGGKTVGVLGIASSGLPSTSERRQHLETVASLLALAVKNVELFRRVRELSMVDPLTGCLLRHYGLATLAGEMRRARRIMARSSAVKIVTASCRCPAVRSRFRTVTANPSGSRSVLRASISLHTGLGA